MWNVCNNLEKYILEKHTNFNMENKMYKIFFISIFVCRWIGNFNYKIYGVDNNYIVNIHEVIYI